jgi:hypothetical protein
MRVSRTATAPNAANERLSKFIIRDRLHVTLRNMIIASAKAKAFLREGAGIIVSACGCREWVAEFPESA